MAQVLGWLINYTHDFKLLAIMSLLDGVKVPARLRPGFKARVRAEIISASSMDSIGRAWVDNAEGEVIASIDRIIYTHLQHVDPDELLRWFRYCSGSEDPARDWRSEG
jgi:3-hydroxyacyl-[acyl-carrier-protein] dehydratase